MQCRTMLSQRPCNTGVCERPECQVKHCGLCRKVECVCPRFLKPEGESVPVSVPLMVSEADIQRLCETGTHWGEWAEQQEYRWEHSTKKYNELPSWDWAHAYWMGDSWVNVMMWSAWLTGNGHEFEVVWDMAEHENGSCLGYVILTNYVSLTWRTS